MGHGLDEISEYRAVILDDAFNLKRDYGNSDFDTRHLFTASSSMIFPELHGFPDGQAELSTIGS